MTDEHLGPYLFVSYARADEARVRVVVRQLEQAGVAVWLDRAGIHGGENYGAEIAEAIKGAAALALFASPASLASRNVRQEIALAWRYETPYLPLLLEPVTIPDELAYWLEASQWIELHDHPDEVWLPQVAQALAPLGITVQLPAATASHRRELPPIAGRERELALLQGRLTAAGEGRGGLVLIGGEAGIGKTTLAEAALAAAEEHGFVVLEGHCFDLAETPPYGPWIDLFAHAPAALGTSAPEAFAVRGTVGAVPSQMALFTQVEDFLRTLSTRQPVALLLDDLHWSDPASLDLLRYLARSVATLPLMVLVTYRSDELTRHHPLYSLLPQLAREVGAERIDLDRLDDHAVRQLVSTRYGLGEGEADQLAGYLQARAEGNALFAGELLRALEETGELHQENGHWVLGELTARVLPPLLRQVIESRVARFDEESQRLLGIAAVIGQTVSLETWTAVAEGEDNRLVELAERAEEAQLLEGTAEANSVRFRHALIREALYQGIPSLRRRRLHRRVGEVLAQGAQPNPDVVATHFQQAGDVRAIDWLIRAGERAQLAYAWVTAAERYETALRLVEHAGTDEAQQGWLSYRIARLGRYTTPQQSLVYLDEALQIAERVGDVALEAAARFSRGQCWFFAGELGLAVREMPEGVHALEALPLEEQVRLDLQPDDQGVPVVTNPRGMLVLVLATSGRLRDALAMGETIREGLPRNTPQGELGWAHYGDRHTGLGIAYAWLGQPAAARQAFAEARARFQTLGNFGTLGIASMRELVTVSLPYFTDQLDERRRLAQQATDNWQYTWAVDSRSPTFIQMPLGRLTGEWEAARLAAELERQSRSARAWSYLLSADTLGEVAFNRGQRGTAWSHVHEVLPEGPATAPGDQPFEPVLALMRLAVRLCLDALDLLQARAWLEAYDRWLDWSGAVLGRADSTLLWAQYHHAEGDPARARQHAEQALAFASEPRQLLALIAVHRFLGQLDTEDGQFDAAEEYLQQSRELAEACRAPFEQALTLLELARLRAAQGRADEARSVLAEVRAICEPLEAKPTLEKVAALEQDLAAGRTP